MSVLAITITLKNNFIKKVINSIVAHFNRNIIFKKIFDAFEFYLFFFGTGSNKQEAGKKALNNTCLKKMVQKNEESYSFL